MCMSVHGSNTDLVILQRIILIHRSKDDQCEKKTGGFFLKMIVSVQSVAKLGTFSIYLKYGYF